MAGGGSQSLVIPLQRKTALRQTRARRLPYSIIRGPGAPPTYRASNGPARAPERTPKALQVADGQLACPSSGVIVAVDVAVIGAAPSRRPPSPNGGRAPAFAGRPSCASARTSPRRAVWTGPR